MYFWRICMMFSLCSFRLIDSNIEMNATNGSCQCEAVRNDGDQIGREMMKANM